MDAIVSALALVRSMVPRATALPADIDLVAEEEPQGTEIVATIRTLVEVLLDDMVAGNVQQSLFDGELHVAVGTLRAAANALPFRVTRAQRNDALGDAAAIIREAGLERYGLDCHVGSEPSGDTVIVSAAVPPATAHVWLLDRLFQRAELLVLSSPAARP